MSLEAALVSARFAHLLSLLLLAGALAFPHYALAGPARAAWTRHAFSLRRLLVGGAAASLLSGLMWFAAVLGGMADDPLAVLRPETLRAAFTGTEYAPIWAARLLLLAGLVALTSRRAAATATVMTAALALASVALTGHARSETGVLGVIHVAADALHLLTAGLWLGALPWLILLLRRDPETATAAVRRFSAVAAPSVALLALTGALQTWLLAGSPFALPGSAWGRWLLLKLALVAGMVGLATWNRLRATPRLPTSAAALRRAAVAELALAAGVVGAVAWLGTLSPTDG